MKDIEAIPLPPSLFQRKSFLKKRDIISTDALAVVTVDRI